jgi:hypothetical protein
MFSDATFAEITFADFFSISGVFVFLPRKGRTRVVAILPEVGSIITGAHGFKLRTRVEDVEIDNGKIITYLAETTLQSTSPDMKQYKLRTYVSPNNSTGN